MIDTNAVARVANFAIANHRNHDPGVDAPKCDLCKALVTIGDYVEKKTGRRL